MVIDTGKISVKTSNIKNKRELYFYEQCCWVCTLPGGDGSFGVPFRLKSIRSVYVLYLAA